MDLNGKLKSPEFVGCTLPLTMYIEGEKVSLGLAYVGADGFIVATVDLYRHPKADKINELIRARADLQFVTKLNPEIRLEVKPAAFPKEDGY